MASSTLLQSIIGELRDLPEAQAKEVFDFVEFLKGRARRVSGRPATGGSVAKSTSGMLGASPEAVRQALDEPSWLDV